MLRNSDTKVARISEFRESIAALKVHTICVKVVRSLRYKRKLKAVVVILTIV